MAQVNVTISGKTYRMACDDGEEAHLTSLAERLNRSVEQLRARFGEIGDQRLTVMAAITLADQQAETERKLKAAEAEIAALEDAHADLAGRQQAVEANVAGSISSIAERLEEIVARMASGNDRNGR
ncbi:MAG TPA: cell division protein ZapA [Bauldia sp.]|jgi:cell division protein ZapA|nr:cell division protein ZapA [Bauldia sp.]